MSSGSVRQVNCQSNNSHGAAKEGWQYRGAEDGHLLYHGCRRRSARISALEEEKTNTGQTSNYAAPTKKRGRKRKDQLGASVNYVATKEDDVSEEEHEFFQLENSQSGGGPHEVDKRTTYQPPACASKGDQDDNDNTNFLFNPDALRKLVQTPFPPGAYEDSLNRFSKDLGPVAQRIAQTKLAELRAIQASGRTEAPGSVQGPRIPVFAGSTPATLVPQPSQNFVAGDGQWRHPFLGRRPESSHEDLNFRRSADNLLPGQYNASDNQDLEASAERIIHGRTSSKFPIGMSFTSPRSDNQEDRLFPAQPSVHMNRFNWAANEQVHQNISNFSASNKGKAISSDDCRNSVSFFSNAISNARSELSTGIGGRLTSPDERGFAQGKTRHPDEKNVGEFLAILGGNNGSETTLASQSPLDSSFASTSLTSLSQLMPTPTLSSLLASPSGGMWLPLQTENRLDQATRGYLDELRSGNFNAIATSNAALQYKYERSTRPVGFGEPAPVALGPMHHSPSRQMQGNEHNPSAVQTIFPLQQLRVAPSQQGPPLNLAGPSGGAGSQDGEERTTFGRSLDNNGEKLPRDFDLNL